MALVVRGEVCQCEPTHKALLDRGDLAFSARIEARKSGGSVGPSGVCRRIDHSSPTFFLSHQHLPER